MIKLLFVDDEKGITDALQQFFGGRGFATITANSGEEAVEKTRAESPDIVFLDIRMKGMGGLEALKKIKEMNNKTKVVMLTIHEEKEIMDTALQYGADKYITKPFRVDYLEETVIKMIQELTGEKRDG